MSAFIPRILPEDPVPPFAAACARCELAGHRERVIWGEGNPGAPVFVILDNPGLREHKEDGPFVCGTRETLQLGLHLAGLDLERIYVSYLLKCRPRRAYDKPAARAACASHLLTQLAGMKPRILFGLGNTVVQTLFPVPETDVKSSRGRWHTFFGIPAAVSYHPLAVRRRPNLMKSFVDDIRLVAARLAEVEGAP